MAINATRFRLLGFRVPMPLSAGWTSNGAWEDDKGFHCDGLLWDVEAFRAWVRATDAAEGTPEGPPQEPDEPNSPESEALSITWLRLCMALGAHQQDWRPAIVGGCPYVVLGHPEAGDAKDLPRVVLKPGQGRTWFHQPEGVHSFNLLIEGGVCALECAEVRAFGEVGAVGATRPMGPGPAAWMERTAAVLAQLPGAQAPGSKAATIRMEGKSMAALLRPLDADLWSFDARPFLAFASRGLRRGRMRWFLDIPLDPIDRPAARAVEEIARLVRERRVSRLGRDACVALKLLDARDELGMDPALTPDLLRTALLKRVYRVALRGYGRRNDDAPVFFQGGLATRLYAFPEAIYLSVSPAFARLAEAAPEGAMQTLPGSPVFETELSDDLADPPHWIEGLPTVADGRIRAFIADLATGA